jgi:hypothetical protein
MRECVFITASMSLGILMSEPLKKSLYKLDYVNLNE